MLESVFGPEMPIAFRLIIVVGPIVIGLLLVVVGIRMLRPTRSVSPLPYSAPISSDVSIARFVIALAEFFAVMFVIVLTLIGGIFTASFARTWASISAPRDMDAYTWFGAIIGGIGGLAIASLLTGLLFTLAEIERSSRRSAAILESLMSTYEKVPPRL